MAGLAETDSRSYIAAFELRSGADCPTDFCLPPAAAGFDAGIFLPRDDPDWFGRHAYPPRILLIADGAFWAVSHPSTNEAPFLREVGQISVMESAHMLLKGWLAFRGAGFNYTARYNTRGHPSVLRFMRRFRSRWLGTGRVVTAEVVLGGDLDMRFANALEDELDPGESVAARFFQPSRESRRRWPLRRRGWTPGDLLAVTGRRLMWITDRDRGSRLQYGSIASYTPLRALQGLRLVSSPNGCHLQVDLASALPWLIPIASEHCRDAQNFAALALVESSRRLEHPECGRSAAAVERNHPAIELAERHYAGSALPPEEEVRRLVACLQSLLEGQSAVEELVACGSRADPPLRDFLLSGRITSVPQPRIWAVEALAGLGAKDVLVEYLQAPKRTLDPQLLLAEDAIKNTAARHLGAWRDDRTFGILLDLCRRRNLPGVIESLAEFERPEAIPCLDRALEDGMCRTAAEAGLRRFGSKAQSALLLSAITPLPNVDEETPSSLGRRRSVLALLTELGVERQSWAELRPLLMERDPEILVRIAQIASAAADSGDRATAAIGLVNVLASVPWYVAREAQEALLALAPESAPAIEAELRRRSSNSPLARAGDEVLRMLLRLDNRLRGFS